MADEGWEARMAARARERFLTNGVPRHDLEALQAAVDAETDRLVAEQRAEHPELFSPVPPEGLCPDCDEWTLDDAAIGRYVIVSLCGWTDCDCACHPEPKGQRYWMA